MTLAAPRLLALALSADASGSAPDHRFFVADTPALPDPAEVRSFADSTSAALTTDRRRRWTKLPPASGGRRGSKSLLG